MTVRFRRRDLRLALTAGAPLDVESGSDGVELKGKLTYAAKLAWNLWRTPVGCNYRWDLAVRGRSRGFPDPKNQAAAPMGYSRPADYLDACNKGLR